MSCYVDVLIKLAKAEVDYLEKKSNKDLDSKTANAGDKNYTKYARDLDKISGFYNGRKQGYAWCDVFVDWLFVQAYGVENAKRLLCQPDKSCGAGCNSSMKYYKAKKQLHTSPKIGDQIFFYNSALTEASHTGVVVDVDSKYVYTIEGNTSSSSGVVANGGCVREKKYSLTYNRIAGYGRPKYDDTTPQTIVTITDPANIKIGDLVEFTGNKHYLNKNIKVGSTCKPGKAKVTAIAVGIHPYHLVRVSGGGSTVHGWVDAKDIGVETSVESTDTDYQCIHVVKQNDTLWGLAVKYLGRGGRYKEIMKLNNKKTTVLRSGQKLKIPHK